MPEGPMGCSAPGRSWSFRQKLQHAFFEHLVADRQHVVASRNIEYARAWHEPRQFMRGTGDKVLGPDRDHDRGADRCYLLARQRLPRAAAAGRKRLEVGFGLLGKRPKHTAERIVNVIQR